MIDRLKPYARRILFGLALVLTLLMLADLNSRILELNRLSREHARISAQSTALYNEYLARETAVAYADSDEKVREWAYTENDFIDPLKGDVLVVVIPDEKVISQPTPIPEVSAVPPENWEIWWALFFDSQ